MNALRRFLSVGGWLAHMFNQFAGPVDFADHDSSVRPIAIFLWLMLPGLLAFALVHLILIGPFQTQIQYAPESAAPAALAGALLPLPVGFIALVAYGWFSGFVPFVQYPPNHPSVGSAVLPAGQPTRVGLTGIVALTDPRIRRRYRNRPTEMVVKDHQISFLVHRRGSGFAHPRGVWAAIAPIDRVSVSEIARGTAFLASKESAALRLRTPQGPVVLTFSAAELRDEMYNALTTMPTSAPDPA